MQSAECFRRGLAAVVLLAVITVLPGAAIERVDGGAASNAEFECARGDAPPYETLQARFKDARKKGTLRRIEEPPQADIARFDACANVARPEGTDSVRQFYLLKGRIVVRDIYPSEERSTWFEFPNPRPPASTRALPPASASAG